MEVAERVARACGSWLQCLEPTEAFGFATAYRHNLRRLSMAQGNSDNAMEEAVDIIMLLRVAVQEWRKPHQPLVVLRGSGGLWLWLCYSSSPGLLMLTSFRHLSEEVEASEANTVLF